MVIQALHLYLSPLRRCKLGLFPQPVEELGPWGQTPPTTGFAPPVALHRRGL